MTAETSTQPSEKDKKKKEKSKVKEIKVEAPKPQPLSGSVEERERLVEAEAIVRRNTLWAVGAGIIVIPGVDILAASAVQVKMLKNLSDLYRVKFSEDAAKKLVASLITGLGGVGVGAAASSLVKLIPGVGTVLGLLTTPAVNAAATHALGRVFIMHFESGGTLLDFDPKGMRNHFQSEFDRAQRHVEQLKKDEAQAPKPAEQAVS